MKPPRTVTPEEKQLWRETMGEDRISKPVVSSPSTAAALPVAKAQQAKSSPEILTPLDLRAAERMFRPHPRIEASLDLHGMTQAQAHHAVTAFLERQQARGARHVEIITGKGREGEGALRTNLPRWLNGAALRPLITAIAHAEPKKGGEGALHVLLRRHRDR